MATTNLIITNAGLAAVAGLSGTDKVTLTEVGFGTGKATVSESTTKLSAEFKRLPVQTGTIDAGTATAHMTVSDTGTDGYDVYEVGAYTSTGVLFAVCSSTTPFISKAALSHVMLAIDLALTNVNPDSVSVGDTNFEFNDASETMKGIIELATEAEAKAGTDAKRAITPKTLDAVIETHDNVVHKTLPESITASKTFLAAILHNYGDLIRNIKTDTWTSIKGGTDNSTGAYFTLYGMDNASNPGDFVITGSDGRKQVQLRGRASGVLTWNGKEVTLAGDCLPLTGGMMTNTIKTTVNLALAKTDAKGGVQICGGTSLADGGAILGYGKDYESNAEFKGALRLQATDGTKTYDVVLFPDGRMRLGNNTQLNFQDNEDQRLFIDEHGDMVIGDTEGALLRVRGQASENNSGGFQFRAKDKDGNTVYLIGYPDGRLTWRGKNVTLEGDCLPIAGGTVTGALYAPTPSASTDNKQVATTAWVTTKFNALLTALEENV